MQVMVRANSANMESGDRTVTMSVKGTVLNLSVIGVTVLVNRARKGTGEILVTRIVSQKIVQNVTEAVDIAWNVYHCH